MSCLASCPSGCRSFRCAFRPGSRYAPTVEVRTPADRLLFGTTYLECRGNKGTSFGTGFFYAVEVERRSTDERGPAWFMVTNRHVAESANDLMLIHMIQGADDAGAISRPLFGQRVGVRLADPLPAFSFHPDADIDVAILPFNKYMDELSAQGGPPMIIAAAPSEMLTAAHAAELDSWEQVIIVGYPDGLYDSHNLTPIVRSGYTASPIQIDYQGRPTFLIDAPIYPGSSGSPVFLVERFGQVAGAFGGTGRALLLGVVAEAQTTRAANLGGRAPARGKKTPLHRSRLNGVPAVQRSSRGRLGP